MALYPIVQRGPGDSVKVDFGDIPKPAYFRSPQSTVQQDMVEVSRHGARELRRTIIVGQQGRISVQGALINTITKPVMKLPHKERIRHAI
jgi:hypothetical protein